MLMTSKTISANNYYLEVFIISKIIKFPNCEDIFEDALFKIGEQVQIKSNISHDSNYCGKKGIIESFIRLDEIEYCVEFNDGNCRFSYGELIKII